MRFKFGIASVLVVAGVSAFLAAAPRGAVQAQRARAEPAGFEYKVVVLSYNPGDRLTDAQRAAQFEKALNAEARAGWEPVASLLTRNTVQTVGGGVTTRDSSSFFAFRRAR